MSILSVHSPSRRAAAVAAIALGVWGAPAARADQVDLALSPGIVEVACGPGQSARFTLSVESCSASDLECRVTVSPMDVDSGGVPRVSRAHALADAGRFVTLAPSAFVAPGGRSAREIAGVVTLPSRATGSYYCLVSVLGTPRRPERAGAGAGVGIVPEVRAVVMITPSGPRPLPVPSVASAAISSGRESGAGAEGWSAEASIRNPGERHIVLEGSVTILRDGKRIVETAPLGAGYGYVFPKRDRAFRAAGRKALPDGAYQAVITVRARGGMHTTSQALPITVRNGRVTLSGAGTAQTPGKKGP